MFPTLLLGCGQRVTFLGLYASDGKFRPNSWRARMQDGVDPEITDRSAEVPKSIDRRARQTVVQNYQPPAHATQSSGSPAAITTLRDQIVTLVYGREPILNQPTHVTADSKGRLIVADEGLSSVQVIDSQTSFRIAGGQDRRFKFPASVAVDASDNIYVLDSERALVLVYDANGSFVRYIGKLDDESLFAAPSGIAIDRKSGSLFVLDAGRNVLFELDLQGKPLRRLGGDPSNHSGLVTRTRRNPEPQDEKQVESAIAFDKPTDIAVGEDEIVIIDSNGSRMQVFDRQFRRLGRVTLVDAHSGVGKVIALAVDAKGDIFVSSEHGGSLRIYDRRAVAKGTLGQLGLRVGEFNKVGGVWIDSDQKMYVSEIGNRRIQVFQLESENKPGTARAGGQ